MRTHARDLTTRPVFMFSSGPVGGSTTAPTPLSTSSLWVVEHKAFAGTFDPSAMTTIERFVVRVVRPRNMQTPTDDQVDGWATRICDYLDVAVPQPSPRRGLHVDRT